MQHLQEKENALDETKNTDTIYKVKVLGFVDNAMYQFHLFKNIIKELQKQYRLHGNVVKTHIFKGKFYLLMGGEWNKLILQNREQNFSNRNGWHFILKRVFPGSIMAMDGGEHLYQRRIMSQAFKKPMLVSYLENMNGNIEKGLSAWEESSNFLVFPHIKNLTLDLATRVFMGIEPDKNSEKMNQSFVDTVEASIAPIRFPVPPFQMWKGVKGRKFLEQEFYRLLPKKQATNTPDFFSQFCHAESEEGERFTDKEIVDHMIFLMMAAHDTTTSTLTTLFYTLAKNQKWQQRLRENSQALGKVELSFEDLASLHEIEWAMKECLRMYPPLPMVLRRIMKDAEYFGVKFKKGDYVTVSPAHTHYMTEYWDEPETFKPERWSSESTEYKNHSHQWIPFGGGAHMCVGQHFADLQVKAVLHQILLKFSWSVPDDYEIPYQLMPIAKPKDGLPISIKRL